MSRQQATNRGGGRKIRGDRIRGATRQLGVEQLESRMLLSATIATDNPARLMLGPDPRLADPPGLLAPPAAVAPAVAAAVKFTPVPALGVDRGLDVSAAEQLFARDASREPAVAAAPLVVRSGDVDDPLLDAITARRPTTAALVPAAPVGLEADDNSAGDKPTQTAEPPDGNTDDGLMIEVLRTTTSNGYVLVVASQEDEPGGPFGLPPSDADDGRGGAPPSGHDIRVRLDTASLPPAFDAPPALARPAPLVLASLGFGAGSGSSGSGMSGSGAMGGVYGLNALPAVAPPASLADSSGSAAVLPLDFDAAGLRGRTAAGGGRQPDGASLAADGPFSCGLGQSLQLAPAGRLGTLDTLDTAHAQDSPQSPSVTAAASAEAGDFPAMTAEKPAAPAGLIDITCAVAAPVQVARVAAAGPAPDSPLLAADEMVGLDRMRETARTFELLTGPDLFAEVPPNVPHAARRPLPAPGHAAATVAVAPPATAGLGGSWVSRWSTGLLSLLAVIAVGREVAKGRTKQTGEACGYRTS